MEQKRGQLTKRIIEKSKELLGYEIDQVELRLIPYIHYVMVNEQRLDISRINSEERNIISKWRESGYIKGGASEMQITKEFWNILNDILYLGYVDLSN